MLLIKATKTFKKDLKRALKNPKQNTLILQNLIDNQLRVSGTVSAKYRPHPLIGNWFPHFECHVQPDFLLIWRVDKENKALILVRCGSHAELFNQ